MYTLEDLQHWIASFRQLGIKIAVNWDTCITFGNRPSRALFGTSPVFRSMLTDPAYKSTRGGREKFLLRMPYDPHEDLVIVVVMIQLAHGQYTHTPRTIQPARLFGVVHIAVEYEMMCCVSYIVRF